MGALKAPKKILIVDDEARLLAEMSRALRSGAVELVTASSLEAAEEAVRRYPFEIVIADITMSGILGAEGLELISFIKNQRPDAKVVITASHGLEGLRHDAYERGADRFYNKPIDILELTRQLEEMGIDIEHRK